RTSLVSWVVFADGNPIFRSSDVVCGGELFTLQHTRGTVVIVDAAVPLLLNIFRNGQSVGTFNSDINGIYAAKGLCVGLQPASRGYAFIILASDKRSWNTKVVTACKDGQSIIP